MKMINLNRNFVQVELNVDDYINNKYNTFKDVKDTIQRRMITGSSDYPKNRTGELSASLKVSRDDRGAGITSDKIYAPFVERRKNFFHETYNEEVGKSKGVRAVQIKRYRK